MLPYTTPYGSTATHRRDKVTLSLYAVVWSMSIHHNMPYSIPYIGIPYQIPYPVLYHTAFHNHALFHTIHHIPYRIYHTTPCTSHIRCNEYSVVLLHAVVANDVQVAVGRGGRASADANDAEVEAGARPNLVVDRRRVRTAVVRDHGHRERGRGVASHDRVLPHDGKQIRHVGGVLLAACDDGEREGGSWRGVAPHDRVLPRACVDQHGNSNEAESGADHG